MQNEVREEITSDSSGLFGLGLAASIITYDAWERIPGGNLHDFVLKAQ